MSIEQLERFGPGTLPEKVQRWLTGDLGGEGREHREHTLHDAVKCVSMSTGRISFVNNDLKLQTEMDPHDNRLKEFVDGVSSELDLKSASYHFEDLKEAGITAEVFRGKPAIIKDLVFNACAGLTSPVGAFLLLYTLKGSDRLDGRSIKEPLIYRIPVSHAVLESIGRMRDSPIERYWRYSRGLGAAKTNIYKIQMNSEILGICTSRGYTTWDMYQQGKLPESLAF